MRGKAKSVRVLLLLDVELEDLALLIAEALNALALDQQLQVFIAFANAVEFECQLTPRESRASAVPTRASPETSRPPPDRHSIGALPR